MEHAVRRVEVDRNLEKESATSQSPQEVANLAKGLQERIQHATHMHVKVSMQNNIVLRFSGSSYHVLYEI